MKPRADSWTIVIRGFWNRMIFSPQWVMDEIFHKQEVEKLVPMDPVAPLIYRNDELVLYIAERQIIVQARKFETDYLGQAEKVACTILGALPKTPVSAIGVNFGFIEPDSEEDLLKLFNFSDDVSIAGCDWEIGKKQIARQLRKDMMILNLNISQDTPSNILIDANFHYPVKSADEASDRIKGHTVEIYETLLKLIKEVYSLAIEEETYE